MVDKTVDKQGRERRVRSNFFDRINRINRISNTDFVGRVSGVGEQALANT